MSAMKVTIRGFYDFMSYMEDDLFKNMVIPESPLLDRNTLILNILQKSDDMESLYSDPYYIQESLTYWSNKWERTFQKWIDALNKQYEPLYNVDMYQDTVDKTTTDRDETINDTLNSDSMLRRSGTTQRKRQQLELMLTMSATTKPTMIYPARRTTYRQKIL